jgi:hypothetical protein
MIKTNVLHKVLEGDGTFIKKNDMFIIKNGWLRVIRSNNLSKDRDIVYKHTSCLERIVEQTCNFYPAHKNP